jgi:hypothetical protein
VNSTIASVCFRGDYLGSLFGKLLLEFGGVVRDGFRVLSSLFGFVTTDEEFDGIDDGKEKSPFEIPEDISNGLAVVKLPGKDDTERKDTCENRERIKTVLINFGDNEIS